MRNTSGSRRISSAIASRRASRTVWVFIGVPSGQSGDWSTFGATGAAAAGAGAAATGAAASAAGADWPASAGTSSPSSTRTAIGVFTLTFSVPSAIRILPMMPSSTASNSIVALSVSISAMMSPAEMVSPSFFSHLARVPSSIVGERAGMRISVAMCDVLSRSYA